METQYFIYALGDPRDGELRYVGCTKDPVTRLHLHYVAKWNYTGAGEWIKQLKVLDLKPVLLCLESTNDVPTARKQEEHWMSELRRQGHLLLNRGKSGFADRVKCEIPV